MKKSIGTLVCGFLLCFGATHAHAALLTEWNYTLSKVELNNVSYGNQFDFTSSYTGAPLRGVTYQSGKHDHSIVENVSTTTSGSKTVEDAGLFSLGDDRVIRYDTSISTTTVNVQDVKIADLSFTYSMASANDAVSMKMQFTFPLYTYYDAVRDTSYVYYNENEIVSMGKSSAVYDNYLYVALGFNLTVNDNPLLEYSTGGNTYKGWAKEGSDSSYEFFVDSSVTMLSYSLMPDVVMPAHIQSFYLAATNPEPAPTPEPATLLLTSLGLAGLGVMKRRRTK